MATEQETNGEMCQACGEPYLTVYRVPDDVWAAITPDHTSPGAGLLCIECADYRAREWGVTLFFEAADGNYPAAELVAVRAEADTLRSLLAELYDGDACDCNAGPGDEHEAECFQTRVEAVL